jgi:hypothetical protein
VRFKTVVKIAKVASSVVGLAVLAYVDYKLQEIAESLDEFYGRYEDYGDIPEGVIIKGEVLEDQE